MSPRSLLSGHRRAGATCGSAAIGIALALGGVGCSSGSDESSERPTPAPAAKAVPDQVHRPGAGPGSGAGRDGVHVFRRGRDLTLGYHVADAARVTTTVSDLDGRRLGTSVDDWPGAGPAVTTVRLSRPASPLRVRLVVESGSAAPRVVDLVTTPARPAFEVVSPTPGDTVRGTSAELRIASRDIVITDQGTSLRDRQGHFHVTLDDRTYVVVYGRGFTLSDLDPGPHVLTVQPAQNDHSPFPGLDAVTVRFRTETGDRIPPGPAARRSWLLVPPAGRRIAERTPTLAWAAARRPTDAYNLQIFDAASGRKVLSRFPSGRRLSVPAGVLQPGRTYVWRVWPSRRGRFSAQPLAISWFTVAG